MNFTDIYRGMADIEWRDSVLGEQRRIRKMIQAPCPDCGGIAVYDGAVCECEQIVEWIGILLKAGIPKAYWELTLEELEVPESSKVFLRFYIKNLENAIERQKGIFFMGPNGTGKTALMAEIGKAALLRGKRVTYTTLFAYMNARFDEDNPIHEELDLSHMILLDEIDKGYGKEGSDFLQKSIQEFMRKAVKEGKTLIMASNMQPDELEQSLDKSIVSLLYRNNQPLKIPGDDFGRRHGQAEFMDSITAEYDYHHPNILNCALQYDAPGVMRERKHGRD